MRYRKGTFITIPNKDLLKGLDPQTQVLYMWLNNYANDDGECFPAIDTLSNDCGMSESTVYRRLDELVDKGLVKKQNQYINNRQTTNLYTMELVGEGVTVTGGGCQSDRGEGVRVTDRTQPIVTQPNEVSFSKENDTLINKENLSGNTNSRDYTKEGEYSVPVDDDGNERPHSPRKKPAYSQKEAKEVYVQFASECVKLGLPKPAPATGWQLKQVGLGIKEIGGRENADDLLAYWFKEASDEVILNIHSAFSSHTINKWRGSQAKRQPPSDPAYANIKVKRYENR